MKVVWYRKEHYIRMYVCTYGSTRRRDTGSGESNLRPLMAGTVASLRIGCSMVRTYE